MFVKCPESRLSEADDVRYEDFLGGEGVPFLSLLLGDLSFLDDDLSGESLLLLSGDLERLLGDRLLLRSEDLRGDRLRDRPFLLLDDGDSLLLLEVGERLSFLSFLLLDGETLLFGDLLLDFKSLFLFVAERLWPVDLLLDLLDRSVGRLGHFALSCDLLLLRRRRLESLSLLLLLDGFKDLRFSELSLLLLRVSILSFFSSSSVIKKSQKTN